jgi:hypothetical protein
MIEKMNGLVTSSVHFDYKIHTLERWYKDGKIHRDGDLPAIRIGTKGLSMLVAWVQHGVVYRPNSFGPSLLCYGWEFWHSADGKVIRAKIGTREVAIENNTVRGSHETFRFDGKGHLGGGELPAVERRGIYSHRIYLAYWDESVFQRDNNTISLPMPTIVDIPAPTPDGACTICLVNKRLIAFGPCGHVACCDSCSTKLGKCPLCRSTISFRLRIYI